MAKFKFGADGDLSVTFNNFFKRTKKRLVRKEDQIMIALNERILALTPVWEGDTIINWRWSTKAPARGHIDPVENPAEPGHTNMMPLGSEPRRAANETRPRQSLMAALRATEPTDIYLSNNSDSAVGLEYGLLPTAERSRSRQGIVRLAIKEVIGRLR